MENVNLSASTPRVKVTDLPNDLQTRLSEAKPEERQSIMDAYLKENRRTLDDNAFDAILNFQRAEADDEAQKKAAEANKKAIAEIQAQKEEAAKLTEYQFQLTAPTEVKDVQSKKEIKEDIKADAKYTDADGVEHKGKDDLKATYKQMKADAKKAEDELARLQKAYDNLPKPASKEYKALLPQQKADMEALRHELGAKIAAEVAGSVTRNDELTEAKQAYKTAKGKGVSKQARAEHSNQKTDNDIAERSHVFASKEEYEAAVKENPALKDHASYVKEDGITLLRVLKDKAEMQYSEKATSNDDVEIDKKWAALRDIEIPEEGDTPELIEEKTRTNQTALRTLAGGDNTISETEKKIMLKADGLEAMGIDRTDINKLYKSYGMHYETRMKGKLRDAGDAMLKALPAAAASALAVRFTKATADAFAHAEQISEATAKATATATAIATAIAHAEASVEGFTFSQYDPETQREIIKQIAGQYDVDDVVVEAIDTQTVTNEVTARAEAVADAEAHAKAQPGWGKALTAAAITVGVAGITGFLLSSGKEKGVNNGDAKDYKNAQFINMHSGNAAKGIAQELLELRDDLSEKLGGNMEAANRQLAEAYGAYEGIQNNVMTLKELAALRDGFKAYVNKSEKPAPPVEEPPVEESTPPVEEPPVEESTPPVVEKKEYHADGNNVYTVERGDVLSEIVKAKYPGAPLKVAMEEIKKLSKLKDINSLRTGQILALPDKIGDVELTDAPVKKTKGGKAIKFNPTKTDAQGYAHVAEGKNHQTGEKIIQTYTGPDAKKRAQDHANRLNKGE